MNDIPTISNCVCVTVTVCVCIKKEELYVHGMLCDKKASFRLMCIVCVYFNENKNEELYILVYVEEGMEGHTC